VGAVRGDGGRGPVLEADVGLGEVYV
jgi:hypothetical protein